MSDNGSIRLLVQFLAGPNVEPLSGFDCTSTLDIFRFPLLQDITIFN